MGCFLAGAILNLILDPIYIFVLGWGVKGAAIATVTSQVLSAVILLVYFLKKGASASRENTSVRRSQSAGRWLCLDSRPA